MRSQLIKNEKTANFGNKNEKLNLPIKEKCDSTMVTVADNYNKEGALLYRSKNVNPINPKRKIS